MVTHNLIAFCSITEKSYKIRKPIYIYSQADNNIL